MKMKKCFKRGIAFLCTVALLAGNLPIRNKQIANASETTGTSVVETSWNGYTSANGTNIVGSTNGKIMWSTNSAGIVLPEYAQNKSTLKLYIKVDLATEAAVALMNKCYVEIANVTCDRQENNWYVGNTGNELAVGTNEIVLNLSTANKYPTSGDGVVLTETIKWFRLYTDAADTAVAASDIKLYEVTLKNDAAGLTFGENDTHLQMSQPLGSTPETIEASVKMEETAKEWVIRSTAETAWGWGSVTTNVTRSTVTEEEATRGNTPEAGTSYVTAPVNANQDWAMAKQFTVDIPDYYNSNDLILDFWFKSDIANINMGYIELNCSGSYSDESQRVYWYMADHVTISAGWNHIRLPLSTGTGTGSSFVASDVNYLRWHSATANEATSYSVTDVKLVVNQDTEWTLISAGEQMNNAVAHAVDNPSSVSSGYEQITATGTVTNKGVGPAVGTTYTEVTVKPYNATTGTGGYFGFYTYEKKYISLRAVSNDIEKDDLVLSFWLWSEDGSPMPTGRIYINSHGWWGGATQEYWEISTYVNSKLHAGWNYIELDFGKLTNWGGGTFDYRSIKYLSWISTGTRWTEEKTVRITDIKLSVKEESTGPKVLHTLLQAGTTLNNAVGWIEGQMNHKQVATTGVVSEGDIGPKAGTVYTQSVINGEGGVFGFWTQNHKYDITWPDSSVVAGYAKNALALSFWIWTETGRKLPTGVIEIGSYGWRGTDIDRWTISNHVNSQITQAGWNYVELDFADLNTYTGTFDYTKICFIAWMGDSGKWTNGGTVRITDINLIVKGDATQSEATPTETVLVSEVNETTLAENDMIFSNTNAGDDSAYALYVTKEGYPTLLWGTTQYTLQTSVRTGEWTDIKVTRNSDNRMEFYLNGVLTGVSDEVETDNLSTFKTAHRIAADGAGKQVFKGNIANLAVYNNATDCMGKYVLYGDTQYIFNVFEDRSDSDNDLVYRGTRASDWTSYEKEKNEAIEVVGEDYWSLIFTQDLQNLTLENFPQSWWTMSEWIANNIETENIQHVVGAGDTTWNNYDSQYQNAMQGFNKFTDKVSWSNISGNHEFTWEGTTPLDRSNTKYNNYFGVDYIQSTKAAETYVESYDDPMELSTTENSYYRFSVNGVKWMILQLEYYPRLSVLAWAKEVAAQYPTDNIILTTHSYINGTGGYCNENRDYLVKGDRDQFLGNTTGKIWDELQTCTNIKLILCGHAGNSTGYIAQKNEKNSEGNSVPAFMMNAQDQDLGSGAYFDNYPMGLLSIFRFSKDGTKVAVQWFSPLYENRSFSPQDGAGERNSNNISFGVSTETCTPIVKPYTSGFVAGTAPSENDVPDGYIFAGWFTNEECTSALKKDSTVQKAYAKFVDKEILSVKAQVRVTDSDSDGTYELPSDETDIRFVTTVDSDAYQKVGFKIQVETNTAQTIESNVVYEKLYAIGQFQGKHLEYHPDKEFSPQSLYFKAFTITGIQNVNGNYDKKIYVTPYWITLDGTTVYGEQGIKTVNQGY